MSRSLLPLALLAACSASDSTIVVKDSGGDSATLAEPDCDGVPGGTHVLTDWYPDADADGFGTAGPSVLLCDAPVGYVADSTDCDDANAAVHPGAAELCNAIDDDCDGATDEDAVDQTDWYPDADGDGVGAQGAAMTACSAPAGYGAESTDCDDADPSVHPGAVEPCGGADADCDDVDPDLCASCSEARATGWTDDGLYTLDIDGAAGPLPSFPAWCDQTTDGGGWTLVQRTVWDWANTSELLTDYAGWYSNSIGRAETGDAYRLAGSNWSTLGPNGEMLAMHKDRDRDSLGDCEPLWYTGSGGTVTVTESGASLGGFVSAVYLTNAAELSTTDSGPSSSCVSGYNAVPWFYSYCCTTCPSFGGSYWLDEPHPMASYTDYTADLYGNISADVCPSGAPTLDDSDGGYEGINVMEFYLR